MIESAGIKKVIRYLVAGGVVAVVQFTLFLGLLSLLHLWYLVASSISFVVALVTSFLLQKYWTFGEKSVSRIYGQVLLFLLCAGINFLVTVTLMYLLVDLGKIDAPRAQAVVMGCVALGNFFLYAKVFRVTN